MDSLVEGPHVGNRLLKGSSMDSFVEDPDVGNHLLKGSSMDSFVEAPDVGNHLLKYSKACASLRPRPFKEWLDSEEFKGWWSTVQDSSSLIIRKLLYLDCWRYLIMILAEADVSRVEHLVLVLRHVSQIGKSDPPHETLLSELDVVDLVVKLGSILATGRFSALKTLRIVVSKSVSFGLNSGSGSLADALRTGQFTNLRTLSLPRCEVSVILEALTEGGISQLTSFSIMNRDGLDDVSKHDMHNVVLRRGYFKNLQHLDLSFGVLDGLHGWEVFTKAVKSGKLPNVTSLRLGRSALSQVNLVDLATGPENWFGSLENLTMDGCGITSEQMCSLVDALIQKSLTQKVPESESKSQLALKSLGLHDNQLDYRAVEALVNLAHSGQLPQLQKLDLSKNVDLNKSTGSDSLITLIESIQSGCLPLLQKLNWESNKVFDAAAKKIVQAYYSDQALTTAILISWTEVSDLSLRAKLKSYRDRNVRLVAWRENANDDLGDFIPLTAAKVFLCGYPEVGKTKLRKTLIRPSGKMTKLIWERRPEFFKEPRTRGIELSRIEEKKNNGENATLILWDLAGQEEYHVLHGTFLADLGFAGGKATTFVLVFKATYEIDVEAKLMYWLRFVASSSLQQVRRHVVIVLNCFHGKKCTETDQRLWMALVKDLAEKFNDSLDVRPDPFLIDVRTVESVTPLKDHLFRQVQLSLQGVVVPRVCFELQAELKGWSEGENGKKLPILTWQAFEEGWALKHKGHQFSAKALKSAASYLHEIGEIIYFEEKEGTNPRSKNRSIVVPDPEWFCRNVVGELLLPKEMRTGGSSKKVSADGSISVSRFQTFFEDLLVEGTQSDDVISMLELVGLCYKKGQEQIVIPALISEDDYSTIDWDGKGVHGAMGRCLATEDQGRKVIPMTLFRRLQVELAQDPNLGGRGDSEYRVGKSFSNFKVGELLVLIQFDVDHSDPTDDRIDVLVKSMKSLRRGDPTNVRLVQVKCISEIMQKLEDLCVVCCPGLRYDIKVIEPSSAADQTNKMSERKLMSLKEIKDLLIKGKEYLSWHLDGRHMEVKGFLSAVELKAVVGIVEREYDECKRHAVTMGLLTEDSLQELEANGGESSHNPLSPHMPGLSIIRERTDQELMSPRIFQEGMQKLDADIRRHIDKKSSELLSEFRQKQELLVKKIQAQQSFSVEEKEGSVPRYMFLSRKQGRSHVWITLKEAFQSAFELHMLCEAHFDDGFVHEVQGQEGIQLRKPRKWLMRISPLLHWSLRVAMVVGQTVGNVYLPGVFNFIPDFNLKDGEGLGKAVDSAATMLLEEDEVNQVEDGNGNCGSSTQPINLKERLIAQEVVKDLISELGHATFAKKIGLRKVLLRETDQPSVGSSEQAQPSVLWICDVCYKKYGDRATDISPRR